jgi:hypothetical protein
MEGFSPLRSKALAIGAAALALSAGSATAFFNGPAEAPKPGPFCEVLIRYERHNPTVVYVSQTTKGKCERQTLAIAHALAMLIRDQGPLDPL